MVFPKVKPPVNTGYIYMGVQALVPTAIQEMVFGVWMIVKGFNPSAVAALSAKRG